MTEQAFCHEPIDQLIIYIQAHADIALGEKAGFKSMGHIHVRVSPSADALFLADLVNKAFVQNGGVDLFDGQEHDAISIGGWMNHPQYNLALMGMGSQLGLWQTNEPYPWFEVQGLTSEIGDRTFAQLGIYSIQASRVPDQEESV
jgi:hypothetical protein